MERFGGRELWPEWVLGVREWREETKWGEGDSERSSSGDYENGIEDAGKERRHRKAVARANRLRIEGREESEEDSEDGDSSEGKLYDKEGVVRGGCPSTNILNITYIFFKLFYRDIKELFNF